MSSKEELEWSEDEVESEGEEESNGRNKVSKAARRGKVVKRARSSSDEESEEDDSDDSEEDESEDEEENTVEALKETLRDMPLAKLAQLKKKGINGVPLHKALGLPGVEYISAWIDGSYVPEKGEKSKGSKDKVRRDSKHSESDEEEDGDDKPNDSSQQKKKKKSRNAPVEMSSKKQVKRFRQVVDVHERKMRDPRFDPLSGKINERLFNISYGFINEMREKEIQDIGDALRKDKKLRFAGGKKKSTMRAMTEEEREEATNMLTRLKRERGEYSRKQQEREVRSEVLRAEREKVMKGKKEYFIKPSELKKKVLEKRFEKLEESGKLDKYMAKRRRKNAAKERRLLPT